MTTVAEIVPPSPVRAWWALVSLSVRRQARMRQMVWIALALLGLVLANVVLTRARGGFGQENWRSRRFDRATYGFINQYHATPAAALPLAPEAAAVHRMHSAAVAAALKSSAIPVFTQRIVFSLYLGFLLPLLSLSFATEALGGEREGRSVVWLTTRPLPRPAVYLAKYVGILPWT